MPVQTTYPGVYIQEIPSGVRTIVGVGTSVAMFIGRSKSGPLKEPVQCLNYGDFERTFSSEYAGSDLARSVRLFFANGGTNCYVMRIADSTARCAKLTLLSEDGTPTVEVIARSAGVIGNDIRLAVDYNTEQPEATFNLEVFRWVRRSNGTREKGGTETYKNISMDPEHPRYARDIVNQSSRLIKLRDLNNDAPPVIPTDIPTALVPLSGDGVSLSGYAISHRTVSIFKGQIESLFTASQCCFRLKIGDNSSTHIDLSSVVNSLNQLQIANYQANLETLIKEKIDPQLPAGQSVSISFIDGPTGPTNENNEKTKLMTISGIGADVFIEPAATNDLANVLMLGTAQGGIEVSRAASRRPAPTGVVFLVQTDLNNIQLDDVVGHLNAFGNVRQDAFNAIRVDGVQIKLTDNNSMITSDINNVNNARMYQDRFANGQDNGRNGIREKFERIISAIEKERMDNAEFEWTAELWGTRLALISTGSKVEGATTTIEALKINGAASVVANVFKSPTQNIRYYCLGNPADGAYISGIVAGDDGKAPTPEDYQKAYNIIDREVDLFNLLILPKDRDHTDTTKKLWGPASVFCLKRRAFLLMDPPSDWTDKQKAVHPSTGVNSLRIGLKKDYSAIFYPRLIIDEKGKEEKVGPCGAIAGLMARIDSSRGVWKAPAGTEADLRGVIGLEYRFSDEENGVMNPKGVNTLRVFPNGIVNWGARTMDGDDSFTSEYKYIPVRRLALYMEESLYQGLKWVVFEPNDEPLWAQIRLNVGAFMHNLFRQGAFQGQTPKDAYFVKCDAETTTQNDRDLGRVNIIVGFAPLKPAEFVIISLQQIAGQIQV